MRILIGVCVALGLALGLVTWQLKGSWQENEGLRAQAEAAEAVNARLNEKFDALDSALIELSQTTRENADRLNDALGEIQTITKQPEDSDETISCLDLRVPSDLDRLLRDDPGGAVSAGGDS